MIEHFSLSTEYFWAYNLLTNFAKINNLALTGFNFHSGVQYLEKIKM
jgi:hypothetical protein